VLTVLTVESLLLQQQQFERAARLLP